MKKPDKEVVIWKDRIERGKMLRKNRMKETKIYVDFYKGIQWGQLKGITTKYKPVVNLIFPHIKSQLPFLYFQHPKWQVRPTKRARMLARGGDIFKNAELAQLLLNYYVQENLGIPFKRQMRLAILDAFFIFGVIKVGYTADFEVNNNKGNYAILGYDGERPIYDIDRKTGEMKIDDREELLVDEKFFIDRISPAAMIFDTEATDTFEDGRYIIEEIVRPLEDVKKDSKYSNTKDLEHNYVVKIGLGISEGDLQKDEYSELSSDLKRITLYEIYDIEHDKLKVIAEGHDWFLRNDEMPEGIDKHPYSFLCFNDIPDEIYPMSDIRPLKSPQEEYNLGRSMIMTHAKRFNRKYGCLLNMIDEDQMDILEGGEDGAIFGVKDLPLAKVIEPLKDAPLDAAVYANFEQSKQDFREVGGATENERGLVERRKTAFEASEIAKGSNTRKEDRRSLVEDFSAVGGKKLLQSIQANLSIPEVVQIAGEVGAQGWMEIGRNEIKGDMLVSVELGSTAPKIPQYERADVLQFMQGISMFPPKLVQTHVNFGGLLEMAARTFDTMEKEDILNSPEEVKRLTEQFEEMEKAQAMLKGGVLKQDKGQGQG